jgi:hypothetical protein
MVAAGFTPSIAKRGVRQLADLDGAHGRRVALDVERARRRGQHAIRRAVAIPLHGRSRLGQAIGARVLTKQIVEAVVLQIEDDDVADVLEFGRLRPALRRQRGGREGQQPEAQDAGLDVAHFGTPI